MANLIEELSHYNMEIMHRPGISMQIQTNYQEYLILFQFVIAIQQTQTFKHSQVKDISSAKRSYRTELQIIIIIVGFM